MAYVVVKPITVGGKRRKVGEVLADHEVTSPVLSRSNMVTKIGGDFDVAEATTGMMVPIVDKDGTTEVPVGVESVSEALRIAQLAKEQKIASIEASEDDDMLLVLSAITTDKTIKAAIRERASVLRTDG